MLRELHKTPMNVSELLVRARSAVGRGVKYKMGSGSLDPTTPTPAGKDGACDCSCFVCWCLRLSKYAPKDPFYLAVNGGWRNTDAMALDAGDARGNLTRIPEARIGCLILYGKGWGWVPVGHVGIVTEIVAPPDRIGHHAKKVVHCSSGNYRTTGDGIRETGPEVFFKRGAIYVWPDFLKGDGNE